MSAVKTQKHYNRLQPGIQPVQALADITRSALCCSAQRNPCTNCKSAE